ncbi:MAG TPA: CHAD domain-containing protein [Ktedonobacterales bacterium]|nr:CHAD domain-containing protein [Ktedonobacterales bacterium]
MEIEAKYAILGPLNPATLSTLDVDPYLLAPEGSSHHQDVVLDTPARAITTAGSVLRLRHMNDQVVLTYKGPNIGANGVREREEIERPLTENQADGSHFHEWPAEIVARIAPLVGDAQLQPLIKTYINRHIWSIERDGTTVGEVALDQGVISAGGRTTRVHELEIELKGSGERADLTALEELLLPALPLQPQPLGKVQRGLALLGRNRTLDGRTPLDVLCIHMVRKHLRKLHQSEPSVHAGADPEGVHDMRVATRRLRTTLRFLEESNLFDNARLHALRRGLRGLAAALGRARDLDVFIERVETYREANHDAEDDLSILMRTLHKRRHIARRALLKKLDGPHVRRLLADLEAFTTETHPASERQPRVLTRHFAGSAIWQRYERVRGFETLGRNMPPSTLHRLRITCKRLRYTMEFFAPELGKGTQPLLGALTRAQDHLGALQDTVVALATVSDLARERPTNAGLTAYCHALMEDRNRLLVNFEPIWNDLCDPSFAQELAELIAGL